MRLKLPAGITNSAGTHKVYQLARPGVNGFVGYHDGVSRVILVSIDGKKVGVSVTRGCLPSR